MSISTAKFRTICRQHPDGLTSSQMIALLEKETGERIKMPCLRKYVQYGLIERSRRHTNGGIRGSLGIYPHTAFLQLLRIREALRAKTPGQDLTHLPLLKMIMRCEAVQTAADSLLAAVRKDVKQVPKLAKQRRLTSAAKKRLGEVSVALRQMHEALVEAA